MDPRARPAALREASRRRFLIDHRQCWACPDQEGEIPKKKSSLHKKFPEFLDCVRKFSVPEARALLKGTWMGGPIGPPRELFIVKGKEPVKYIWDHLEEFIKRGRKAIQAYLAEYLDDEVNSEIIANAIWSCIWEHSEELKSDDGQAEKVKQEIQDPQPGVTTTPDESEEQGAGKTAHDHRNLVEQRNIILAKSNSVSQEKGKQLPENWDDKAAYPIGHTKAAAARILTVNRSTIYDWISKKKIAQLTIGRISISEIKRVKESMSQLAE